MTVDLSPATRLLDRRSWPEARALAVAALTEDPRRAEALRVLAAVSEGEGRLDDADRFLSDAVAVVPEDAASIDELIRVSHLRSDLRRLGEALLARLRISPGVPALWNDLGAVLERLNDPRQAAACYRRSIAVDPTQPPAIKNAAALAYHLTDFPQALRLALRGLVVEADAGQMLVVGGHAQQKLGAAAAAARSYHRALALGPGEVPAWEGLAALRRAATDDELTLLFLLRAATRGPIAAPTLASLSEAHRALGHRLLAARCARRSLSLAPDLALGSNALAMAKSDLEEDRMATAWARRTLHLDPANGELMINLGIVLKNEGCLLQAQAMLRAGLARRPNDANGHMALATTLMSDGNVREGFSEYEWRHAPTGTRYDQLPAPRWDGRPLRQGTLLVWGEQGIGDEVMFIQYLRLLRSRVKRLVVECEPRLLTMFERSFPNVEFVVRTAPPARRLFDGTIDAQIAMLSLPNAMRLDKADLHSEGAYLRPEPHRVASLQRTFDALNDRPRVGIAWRSGRRTAAALRVSTDLLEWLPILAVPGVTFVNLQYGEVDSEIAAAEERSGTTIVNLPDLNYFEDLEGVLALGSHLDLVISTGTSACCFAAASGIEIWQLQWRLAYSAYGDDTDCSWPRARAFVKEPGETWSRPIAAAAAALEVWARDFRRS